MSRKLSSSGWAQPLLICVTGFIISGIMGYSFYLGDKVGTTYPPLINAVCEMKLQATSAHLWFEEIMSGDQTEHIAEVWSHLERADSAARILLAGTEARNDRVGDESEFRDSPVQADIIVALEMLSKFSGVTCERLASIKTAGAGTKSDQQNDIVFAEFIVHANAAEKGLELLRGKHFKRFRLNQTLLFAFGILLTLGITRVCYRWENSWGENFRLLSDANKSLELEIAERRRAEKAMRDSKVLYQDLIETSQDLIWRCDVEGKFTFLNHAWEKTHGYQISEMLGHSFTEFQSPEVAERDLDEFGRLLAKGSVVGYETTHLARSGNEIHLVFNAIPLYDGDGKVIGTQGTAYDVTERKRTRKALKKSEERFAEVFESIVEGMGVVDENECVEYCNPAYAAIFEESSPEVMTGKCLLDYVVEAEHSLVKSQTDLRRKHHQSQYELNIITAKGNKRVVLAAVSPRLDDEGNYIGAFGAMLDITARYRAEEDRRESEEKYRRFVATTTDALVAYDADTRRIIEVNPACEQLYGYSRDELLKLEIDDIWDESEEFQTGIGRFLAGSFEAITIRYNLKKDGSKFPVEISTGNFRQGENRIVFGLVRDISKRVEAEEESRQQHELMIQTIESLTHPFRVVDATDYTVKLGNTASGFTSCDGEKKCYALSHQNDRPCSELGEICPVEIVKRTGKPVLLERVDRDSEGNPTHFEVHGYPILDGNGKVTRVIEYSLNITDRKRAEDALWDSEEKFRNMAELLPEGLFETDENLGFTYLNPRALEFFGYPAREIADHIGLAELMAPEDRNRLQTDMQRIMDGHLLGARDYMAVRKDGTRFPVVIHCNPVSRLGRAVGVRGLVADYTERKQIERELLKVQKLETVGILAGGIAHDFNNILTGILGNISLAKMDVEDDADVHALLDEAENASMQAKDLTQQLLTFSRGGEPVKALSSLEELIRSSATFCLRGSNVTFDFVSAPDLSPVEIDSGQIGQVMQNLFINAHQAMPDGGNIRITAENVTIEGNLHSTLPAGFYVRTVIRDEGVGIAADKIGRVFDPFYTTRADGTGLGLASSYSIMQRHGGSIEVVSEVGHGTTFTIHLPATDKEMTTKSETSTNSASRAARILVMDDETFIRDLVSKILSKFGYSVDDAANAEEAVNLYRTAIDENRRYDIVILDLTIPGGKGGKEVINELQAIDPDVKALVSSGYSNDPVLADYTKFGFSGIINKPYRPQELAEAISELLSESKTATS